MKKIILFIIIALFLVSIVFALTIEESTKLEQYYNDPDKKINTISSVELKDKFAIISFDNSSWRVITTQTKFNKLKDGTGK